VLLAGPPVVREDLGGELWFYYNACRFNMDADAHREHDGAAELHRLGITAAHFLAAEALCLAKLRPQGLVSLDAGRQGTLVSRPFVWPAGGQHALWLNVDAQWGEVFVEVVDVETAVAPLAGFGGRNLPPLVGDHPRGVKMVWQDGRTAPDIGSTPVRLKFYYRQARLYSFWLSADPAGAMIR
jgi:hypothetical protein